MTATQLADGDRSLAERLNLGNGQDPAIEALVLTRDVGLAKLDEHVNAIGTSQGKRAGLVEGETAAPARADINYYSAPCRCVSDTWLRCPREAVRTIERMYADEVRIVLNSFQFSDKPNAECVTRREEWTGWVTIGADVEVGMEELQRWVFENVKPEGWYECSKTESLSETGGSGAHVEIVITMAEWSSMLAWGVLGNMISDYIRSKSRRDDE